MRKLLTLFLLIAATGVQAQKPEFTEQGIQVLKDNDKAAGMKMHEAFVRVKNVTGQPVSYLGITVTYYDQGGNIIGTGYGNAANIANGAERTVTCIANNIVGAKKYIVEVSQVNK